MFPHLFSLLLFITAAQGEAFQGLTHLPASLPQRQCPGTAAGALHHRLPLPGRTEGLVPAVAETDRERRGVQRSGGCMHRWGRAVRRAVTCNPPKAGLGVRAAKWQLVVSVGIIPSLLPAGRSAGQAPVPGPRGQRPKHIHLRDPVDERLLPGRDIAAVPRVLGAGELQVKHNRERR